MSGRPAATRRNPVIPVTILNWNGEADTLACLASIRAAEPAGFVPVVVDNGSQPESLEQLRQACRERYSELVTLPARDLALPPAERRARLGDWPERGGLLLIESPENLGFARASNLGVRVAEALESPWVMLLNNDTEVAPDAFARLRAFIGEHPSVAAVTAQIRWFNDRSRIQNCGGDLTYFGSRRYRFVNQDAAAVPPSAARRITFATGCALLFRHQVTGPLSEQYFFGEEDYEFALRLRQAALPMACAFEAVVYHKGWVTISRNSSLLGFVILHYAARLINVRNYYSPARWHATRILAYLYLPVLLAMKKVPVRNALAAIRRIESFISRHGAVSSSDFQSLVNTAAR